MTQSAQKELQSITVLGVWLRGSNCVWRLGVRYSLESITVLRVWIRGYMIEWWSVCHNVFKRVTLIGCRL